MPVVTLSGRSFVDVTGEEAESFLQNLITTDLAHLPDGEAWPGALLTPQGKIMFEFLIGRANGGFVLETAGDVADALVKRLTLYRLRAKVDFAKRDETTVTLVWNEDSHPHAGFTDHRFSLAGVTLLRVPGAGGSDAVSLYRSLRMELAISGGAEDGALTDHFPHDLLMDRNGGVAFKKGCYVGQEVVSRMQHRSTARRRLVSVSADYALAEAGAAIEAAGREIGTLIATEGNRGLAVVRIDKAGAALAASEPITCGGQTVTLTLAAWSGLEFPAQADETAS